MHNTLSLFFRALKNPSIAIRGIKISVWHYIFKKAAVVQADGITFKQKFLRGRGVWSAISGLEYDDQLVFALSRVKAGDHVIDLGANVGAYTLRLSKKVGPKGKVFAVEANKFFFDSLCENIKLNDLKNIIPIHAAASDSDGRTVLVWNENYENSGSVVYNNGSIKESVDKINMDRLLADQGIDKISFIKLDIEGSEVAALKGLSNSLSKYKPDILFENSSPETIRHLKNCGYKIGLWSPGGFVETEHAGNLWAIRIGDQSAF